MIIILLSSEETKKNNSYQSYEENDFDKKIIRRLWKAKRNNDHRKKYNVNKLILINTKVD